MALVDLLDTRSNHQFVKKNIVSANCNKAKYNKTKYVYINSFNFHTDPVSYILFSPLQERKEAERVSVTCPTLPGKKVVNGQFRSRPDAKVHLIKQPN